MQGRCKTIYLESSIFENFRVSFPKPLTHVANDTSTYSFATTFQMIMQQVRFSKHSSPEAASNSTEI